MKPKQWAWLGVTACLCFAAPARGQAKPGGVPVPEDGPLFNAFKLIEKQPAYRMTMTMQSSDPRMAQMMAHGMGMSPTESVVRGGVHQVIMHMKIPAMDQPGTIDDWEIRAVVQNGHGARLITSPAVPRLLRLNEQRVAMQLAMLDQQAATAMARAAISGPLGWISAATTAAATALGNVMAARALKQQKEFFSWKCMDKVGVGQEGAERKNVLTDMRLLDDQTVEGKPATAYEFFVRDGDKLQGPVRLLVTKDSGLPLRMEMTDPQGRGSMHMDYSYDNIGDIEMPACMASGQ